MKFCVTADLHIKMWADSRFNDTGIPLKLIEILEVFTNICMYARKNKIKHVFIAGDVNDLKNIVHYRAFVLLKNIIQEYDDLNFVIISGNHDEAAREDVLSAVQLLDGPNNVKTVVDKEYVLEDVTFIPWSASIPEMIKSSNSNKVLISHLGLSEAKFSSGISMRTSIGIRNLKKFNLVILGHYHLPQQVGHVYYVGSPIQLNRGEKNEEKRFLVVDTEDLSIESITTEGYRKYYEFEVNSVEELAEIQEEASKLSLQGNYVSIRNKGIKDLKENIDNVLIIDETKTDHQIRGISSSMDLKKQMTKYLEIEEIPKEDHERYVQTVVGYLKE